MAGWLIPVIKSVLPYAGTIISAAAPMFTRKSGDTATLQQQITELQTAASANDAHIKGLAVQMQAAIEALEKAYRRAMLLGIASFILSVAAMSAVLLGWFK